MGLQTSHSAFNGSYTQFNDFRYCLAAQKGLNLDDYKGYRGQGEKELKTIKGGLSILFQMSDCDGFLTPDECLKIASELTEVLDNYKFRFFDYKEFKANVKQFKRGCIWAFSVNENLEFL